MPRGAEISSTERNFLQESLLQGLRIDGRSLDQFRNISLDFGTEYGTATVRLGKTRFVAKTLAFTRYL